MGEPRRTVYIGLVAAGLVALALLVRKPAKEPPGPAAKKPAPPAFVLGSCPSPTGGTVPEAQRGDPRARAAAQRGLDFLGREARAWQEQHNCYGCHVHAVTLEAMVVGKHHQYEVKDADLGALVDGMLNLSGGARDKQGFAYQHSDLLAPSKAFGGAAFAHYDAQLRGDLANDLIKTAGELLAYQRDDGSVEPSWFNPPVGVGAVQETYQAVQTWRQAYARTADDKWLLPIQRAERYLQERARAFAQTPPTNLQEINYALMGLQAAGVGSGEEVMRSLIDRVLKQQAVDGSWSTQRFHGESEALATGQTLYTLRLIGLADNDPVIVRGTQWLIAHQNEDGGWSHGGFGKAEAMWAVLGLVSVDVLSVAVSGVQDGQHVDGDLALGVEARDNAGGGVVKVELAVDDVPTYGACGAKLAYVWKQDGVDAGKHLIDVVATNARGQVSKRRLEVYTGPTYLTQIGSRAADDGTVVSLRDIAAAPGGTVELHILDAGGKEVAEVAQPSIPGPMSLAWNGVGGDGKPQAHGRYTARLVYRDHDKRAVQTEEIPFVRDTVEAQQNGYGAIEGQLNWKGGVAANAPVELVDGKGNVVQRQVSTAAGKYLFKNVDGGEYHIRINKRGFRSVDKPVAAEKAKKSSADAYLE